MGGLKQMWTSSEARERQMDKLHAETMEALAIQREALSELVERPGGKATTS